MDGQRFDAFTRTLGSGVSRRAALRAIAAGIGAVALGLIGRDPIAAAKCRTSSQICRKPDDCCSDFCGPKDATGRRRCDVCADGAAFCDGSCCDTGSVCIDGACCANPCGDGPDATCCGAGATCLNGHCCEGFVCNDTFCCGDTSICTVDVCCASDDVCSAGGKTFCCGAGTGCDANGCLDRCEIAACSSDTDCGDGLTCCNGCCVDTESDDDHCGGCGIDCGISQLDPNGLPNACCAGSCSTIPVCIE